MKSLNIMVVDDSAITIKKISKILVDLGHNVVHVSKNGADAVEAYSEVMPDLITMDITMPDMDGIEATKQILQKNQDAIIIMITSHGQEQMVMDSIESGALGYVIKPFKIEKIKDAIDRVISEFG